MPIFLYDPATKGVPLQALPESAWRYLIGQPEDEGQALPITAYKRVAWLYRAVDLRAKAVQKMPYAIRRAGSDLDADDPLHRRVSENLSHLLYRSEAALCLYAASYWKLEKNPFGLNTTPRWLLPASITPQYDTAQGLTGFRRAIDRHGTTVPLALNEVVYCWTPSLEAEIGPGVAPATVAMMAAGVLRNQDLFREAFFKRGAIKATLLQVEGNPTAGEMEKLEAWWKRMLSGVKNAYANVAIRATLKPIVIGDGLKEAVNPALTNEAREDIATALGVPHSLMASNVLAGGTAAAEQINFYDQTVIPECDLIAEQVNAQWLAREGLELVFEPKRLEVYQAVELQKADAVAKVVGRPVLTVDEGRDLLGYPPLTSEQRAVLAPVPEHIRPASVDPDPDADPSDLAPEEPTAKQIDLDRWQRKALKRLRERASAQAPFVSAHLDDAERAWVADHLAQAASAAQIKAVFAAAKARSARVRRGDAPELIVAVTRAAAERAREAQP